MGLLGSIIGKSKVKAANKKVQAARELTDVAEVEKLLKEAMLAYESVESDSSAFKDALYNWGFSLLHLARLKEGDQARGLYEEATKKFSYCLVAKSDYLAAALDWGVALMELAPLLPEEERKATYALAKDKFSIADNIHQGVAAYNFACLHAVNKDYDACKVSLELARDYRNLPDQEDILSDMDMQAVIALPWFEEFMASVAAIPKRTEVKKKKSANKDDENAESDTAYSDVTTREDGVKIDYKK